MNIGTNAFRIIVHQDKEHPPPHCHVWWSDGTESWVVLPTLEVLFGKKLTKDARQMILDNLDELVAAWDQYHPPKDHKKQKQKG